MPSRPSAAGAPDDYHDERAEYTAEQKLQRDAHRQGGTKPYVWSIAAAGLPPVLSLDSATGVISGRAGALGTFTFTVQVQDSQPVPATVTKTLSIEVRR